MLEYWSDGALEFCKKNKSNPFTITPPFQYSNTPNMLEKMKPPKEGVLFEPYDLIQIIKLQICIYLVFYYKIVI